MATGLAFHRPTSWEERGQLYRQELDRRLADPAEDATETWDAVQQRLKPRP